MRLPSVRLLFAIAFVAACGGTPAPNTAPEPSEHALSGLAGQPIVVLPTYAVTIAPELGWAAAIGSPTAVKRMLDADILAALDERGLRKVWIFPADLQASYQRNSTYATDPYALSEEPLRSPNLAGDVRLPEPLSSQLRTLIALHENARLVLAPVELRFEKAGTGGRGVLRLVLVDPRYSNVRWVGNIASDTVAAFGPAITASIAARLANVVAVP